MANSMRTHVAWLTAAVAVGVVGGCTAQPGGPSSQPPTSTSAGPADSASSEVMTPAGAPSAKQICEGAFDAADLLDWGPGTVAGFRTYQFGGPKAKVPLAHAFPEVPGSTVGAWCGIKDGSDSTHWWAVVAGHDAASVITITGPGEGLRHGSVAAPPQAP